jgi:hypothetical protein
MSDTTESNPQEEREQDAVLSIQDLAAEEEDVQGHISTVSLFNCDQAQN